MRAAEGSQGSFRHARAGPWRSPSSDYSEADTGVEVPVPTTQEPRGPEAHRLLSLLIEAGYVHESGRSATGSLWRFTPEAVRRVEELGCDDPAVA